MDGPRSLGDLDWVSAGQIIVVARVRRSLSPGQLAAAATIDPGRLVALEKSAEPPSEQEMLRLAAALGIPVAWLRSRRRRSATASRIPTLRSEAGVCSAKSTITTGFPAPALTLPRAGAFALRPLLTISYPALTPSSQGGATLRGSTDAGPSMPRSGAGGAAHSAEAAQEVAYVARHDRHDTEDGTARGSIDDPGSRPSAGRPAAAPARRGRPVALGVVGHGGAGGPGPGRVGARVRPAAHARPRRLLPAAVAHSLRSASRP